MESSLPHSFDLGRYAERIGYKGPFEPTLPVLRDLMFHHVCAIPFENLNVLLNRPVLLDGPSLEQKLVFERRGGYCFEQNGFMEGILSQIGFAVAPYSARVLIGHARGDVTQRTHLLLGVTIEGVEWIVDVGVGGFSLTAPLLRQEEPQETPHEPRRIVSENGKHYHQCWSGEAWEDIYEFSDDSMHPIDREVANHYVSTHPNERFRFILICARALPDGTRVSLFNDQFTRRRGAEVLERHLMTSGEEILETLESQFGLSFPPGTQFGEPGADWPR